MADTTPDCAPAETAAAAHIVAKKHPASCQGSHMPCMPHSLAGAPAWALPCMTRPNGNQHVGEHVQPPPVRQVEAVQASTARQRAPTPDYHPEPADSFQHHHGDPDFSLSAATVKPVPSVSPCRSGWSTSSGWIPWPGLAQDAACAQPVKRSTSMKHCSRVPQLRMVMRSMVPSMQTCRSTGLF